MQWIGWIVAIVASCAALWAWRRLVAERAHSAQQLYARMDAENQAEQLRASQLRSLHAARQAALGAVVDDVLPHLHARLRELHGGLEQSRGGIAEYRGLVAGYDAAVQYCLQPVELIFGADKASLDQLVQHVEGARRRLFEARGALEKSGTHRGDDLLHNSAAALAPLDRLGATLAAFTDDRPVQPGVDLNASVDAVLDLLAARSLAMPAIVRDYQLVPPLPETPARLHELLLHVLDNAVRASGAQGRVAIATRAADGAVEIAVTDSGAGIPDDVLPHVFEPFFTTRPDATGIGLAVVRRIVDERGGTIAIRTTRGHGSTFTLTLPLRPLPAAAAAGREAAPSPPWAAGAAP